jgi:hypothetical protein
MEILCNLVLHKIHNAGRHYDFGRLTLDRIIRISDDPSGQLSGESESGQISDG